MANVKDLDILEPEFHGDYVTVKLYNPKADAFAPDAVTISVKVYTADDVWGLCWEEQFEDAVAAIPQKTTGSFDVHKVEAHCSCWPGQVTRVRVIVATPDGAYKRKFFPYLDGNPFAEECAPDTLALALRSVTAMEQQGRQGGQQSWYAVAPRNGADAALPIVLRASALRPDDPRICRLPHYGALVAQMAVRGLKFGLPSDLRLYLGVESTRLVPLSSETARALRTAPCACQPPPSGQSAPRAGLIPSHEAHRYLVGKPCPCTPEADLVAMRRHELAPYEHGQLIIEIDHAPALDKVSVLAVSVAVADSCGNGSVHSSLLAIVPPYDPFA